MNQRPERLAVEIQAALADIMARGELRDSRVRAAGIVTITRVRVTGDLREARVAFTVFGADASALGQVREGLNAARVYLQQALARRLRARRTALLSFEIDRGLDHAFRIDGLLREAALRDGPLAAAPVEAAEPHPDQDRGQDPAGGTVDVRHSDDGDGKGAGTGGDGSWK